MEETIVCPNCGETNPADLLYCQNCQWRLRALDEDWAASGPSDRRGLTGTEPGSMEEGTPVPDWLLAARSQTGEAAPGGESAAEEKAPPAASTAGEDLLAGLSNQESAEEEEVPDWVAQIMGLHEKAEPQDASAAGINRQAHEDASPPTPERSDVGNELWRSAEAEGAVQTDALAAQEPSAAAAVPEPSAEENAEISDWLRQLDATAAQAEQPASPTYHSTQDVPDWVDKMMGVPGASAPRPADGQGSLPTWLTQSAPEDGKVEARPREVSEGGRLPEDRSGVSQADQGGIEAPSPEQKIQPPASERPAVVPAFPPEDIQRLDVDAVFASMQMPDWLADLERGHGSTAEALPPAAQEDESIAPADLPAWVEAMRPVETAAPPTTAGHEEDLKFEEGGPLLGLQGVLPAIPGTALPSGKPKSQSMKLDATELHQAHAQLLEELIAAESVPLPLKTAGQVRTERTLRWAIAAVLVLIVGGASLANSRIFPLPAAVPNESIAALQAIETLPADARVLTVFDYEPSTVGEMEATASSLMDHLLLLKHPRLAVLSTSPTGSALAERFMAGTLVDRAYERGRQYVNLGYLPGGLAGVQSFAQDPHGTIPLGASSDRVWESGVLLGVQHLSDFDAIIVLSESLESGRVWIEQTASARGAVPMVMVSSAQAGPMLLPYFDAGQISGLVAGLNGAAGAELANGGLPGLVRKYWDAYSLGLYMAVLLITFGSAWQLWSRFREARAEAA